MQGFEPSIDLEFENGFFKKVLDLKKCFGRVSPPIEVVTGHCKNAMIRAGDHFGGTL